MLVGVAPTDVGRTPIVGAQQRMISPGVGDEFLLNP